MANQIMNEQERKDFVYDNLTKNSVISTVEGSFFSVGLGMVPLLTTLTYFVSDYVHSNVIIGLLGTMAAFCLNLPQVFMARYVESREKNMGMIVFFSFFTRFVWFLMGISVIFVTNKTFVIISFYLLYGVYNLCMGFISVPWFDLIAKVIPPHVRGRFFGVRTALCSGSEFLGALLSAFIISKLKEPYNYGVVFILVGVFTTISLVLFCRMKEPSLVRSSHKEPMGDFIKKLKDILVKDRSFRFFIFAIVISLIGGAAANFRIVYAKSKLGITEEDVQFIAALWVAVRAMASIMWGYVNDKKGFKFTMVMAFSIYLPSYLLMNFMINVQILYLIIILHAIAEGAIFVTQNNFIVSIGGEKDRATYLGLSAMIFTPVAAIGPILIGKIIDLVNFNTAFYLAGILMAFTVFIMYTKVKAIEVE